MKNSYPLECLDFKVPAKKLLHFNIFNSVCQQYNDLFLKCQDLCSENVKSQFYKWWRGSFCRWQQTSQSCCFIHCTDINRKPIKPLEVGSRKRALGWLVGWLHCEKFIKFPRNEYRKVPTPTTWRSPLCCPDRIPTRLSFCTV